MVIIRGMNTLFEHLEPLPLNEKERLVLAVLYERGPLPVSRVARLAKTERTLTYKIVKELERKGYAHSIKMDEGLVYRAQDIETIIFAEKRGLQKLQEAQRHIEENKKGKPDKTDLMVFEGFDGIRSALYYGMEDKRNDELWGIYRDVLESEFIPLLNERHLFYKEHGIKSKILFAYSHEVARHYLERAKENGINTECRVVNAEPVSDEQMKRLSSIEIFQNNMKMYSFEHKRAIVITDAQAVEMERLMFTMLWQNAEEV
jgi:DNA-binding MarR family transcriptional regulator